MLDELYEQTKADPRFLTDYPPFEEIEDEEDRELFRRIFIFDRSIPFRINIPEGGHVPPYVLDTAANYGMGCEPYDLGIGFCFEDIFDALK